MPEGLLELPRWAKKGADTLLCTSSFQYGLGHFLHEQRNTIRALNDILPRARRNDLVADNVVDHRLDVALRQPIEGVSNSPTSRRLNEEK